MKKTLAIIVLVITFFIIYFLQANFFTWFNIGGVMPNLFVIFVLFIGLFVGKKVGVILGIVFGVYLDIVLGNSIFITGALLGLIGLISEFLEKNFSKDSRITIILIISVGTALFEVSFYIFKIIATVAHLEFLQFIKTLAIEIIFNILITIILYPIIQKTGNILEKLFKNTTLRYFK